MIPAEELPARRRQEHSIATAGDRQKRADLRGDIREQGSHKRRRTGSVGDGTTDQALEVTRGVGPLLGELARGKKKRMYKPASDTKRRREAATAAFDELDTDEDGPAPAGLAPFSSSEVEEPDNPMDVG